MLSLSFFNQRRLLSQIFEISWTETLYLDIAQSVIDFDNLILAAYV